MTGAEEKTAYFEQEMSNLHAEGEVTVSEFMAFAKEFDVNVSLSDLPKHLDEGSNLGLVE